jgi:hypothetical protein
MKHIIIQTSLSCLMSNTWASTLVEVFFIYLNRSKTAVSHSLS